jgi:hypothetical protein
MEKKLILISNWRDIMAKNNYIQFRVSNEQKNNIQTNATRNNQTITDYIMTAIMEFEKRNFELYGSPYGYGCPYQFARDYLIKYGIRLEEKDDGSKCDNSNYARQVIRLAIEVLDKEIDKRSKSVNSLG